MIYNVFGGTLNLTRPANNSIEKHYVLGVVRPLSVHPIQSRLFPARRSDFKRAQTSVLVTT